MKGSSLQPNKFTKRTCCGTWRRGIAKCSLFVPLQFPTFWLQAIEMQCSGWYLNWTNVSSCPVSEVLLCWPTVWMQFDIWQSLKIVAATANVTLQISLNWWQAAVFVGNLRSFGWRSGPVRYWLVWIGDCLPCTLSHSWARLLAASCPPPSPPLTPSTSVRERCLWMETKRRYVGNGVGWGERGEMSDMFLTAWFSYGEIRSPTSDWIWYLT